MSSYLQLYTMGVESLVRWAADDRCMVNLPLFHVGGTAAVYAMLAQGGSIAVVDAFDTARVLATRSRETGTTTAILLGVMATFLVKQPPSPQRSRPPVAHRHHGAARRGRGGVLRALRLSTSTPCST